MASITTVAPSAVSQRVTSLLANRYAQYPAPYGEHFHAAWVANRAEEREVRLARAIVAQWLGAARIIEPDELIVGRLESQAIVWWDFSTGVHFNHELYYQRLAAADDTEREALLALKDEWQGHTTGDLMARAIMPHELPLMCYHGPSAPGCPSSPFLVRLAEEGTAGLRQRVLESREAHLYQPGCERPAWWQGMLELLDGIDAFAAAYAEDARTASADEPDPIRRAELLALSQREERASQPSATFAEALQAYWLVALLHRPDSPGRFDQDLAPWLERDLAAGRITMDEAQELVDCIWIKMAQNRCWSLTLGGQTPEGDDATNVLTWLCLNSLDRLRTDAPNVELRVHRGTPPELLRASCQLLAEGFSMPAIVNDEPVINAMLLRGISLEHARDYTLVGCTQVVSRGRCSGAYEDLILNVVKCLELALHDGYDIISGQQMGPHTGAPQDLTSYADLERAWSTQLTYAVEQQVDAINRQFALVGEYYPDLLKSMLIEGCLEQGKDLRHGGALYTEDLADVLGLTNVAIRCWRSSSLCTSAK
ncbi:MAG: hypothetical protein GXY52_09815 [Chloroflexi bacterium]|nr:hypothetical protein [Chloroflexota bacterium]